MILIISGIVLFLGIILVNICSSESVFYLLGVICIIFSCFFGFLAIGVLYPIETEIIIPEGAFMEKNENSIIIVVPEVGNKVITDPAIISYLSVGDTIKIKRRYNSYGIELDPIRIYVEKNGYKY